MNDRISANREFDVKHSLLIGRLGSAHCSPMLCRILACLIEHGETPVSRATLIAAAWPNGEPPTATAALHVHIVHLRKIMANIDTNMRIASGRKIKVFTFYALRQKSS